MINWTTLGIFIALFLLVTVIGFVASRWRRGDMQELNEWGLGGRRFGTTITWFLLGGDLYTAYTFIAVPAAVFAAGAYGFFAVPYTIIVYPLVFVVMPRLWAVSKKHGYITTADFVKGRFDSRWLALAVSATGILATMPYIALQLVGMQTIIGALGITGTTTLTKDLPLIIAFIILAVYTYSSGLRAPALIALVKDLLIYIAVIAIIIVVPLNLGGFGAMFKAVPAAKLTLSAPLVNQYWTLALGSALALFLYPHSITGVLSSKSGNVVKRNAALLPAYSMVLALLALIGFMAIADKIAPTKTVVNGFHVMTANDVVPALIMKNFDPWFVGVAFAAIAIGALVPAAVMSIAASNTFTRNIYKEFFRPNASNREESEVAKVVSLFVKAGALAFIFFVPVQNALDFQLLGGIWVLQTLPPVILGLYTRWFHRWGLLIGWAAGMVGSSYLVSYATNAANSKGLINALTITHSQFSMIDPAVPFKAYIGVVGLLLNLVVTVVFSLIFNALRVSNGKDATVTADYADTGEESAVAISSTLVQPAEE